MFAQLAVWSLGVLTGSGLGGVLAQPATHYPRTFPESGVFGRCVQPHAERESMLHASVSTLLFWVGLPLLIAHTHYRHTLVLCRLSLLRLIAVPDPVGVHK